MWRAMVLIGAGLLGETVYLALSLRLPWWRYGAALTSWPALLGAGPGPLAACLAGVCLLFASYAAGWLALRAGEDQARLRPVVWMGAALFASTAFCLLPITSDLFTYLSQAHLFTDLAANPFAVPALGPGSPGAADALLRAYPALYSFRPSVYGPGWLLLSLPATAGSDSLAWGIGYLKGLVALAYLACAWLLQRIAAEGRARGVWAGLGWGGPREAQVVYLFAWNPLIVLLGVGDGHNDLVMMAGVLLSVWLLLRGRWLPAVALLTLSAWIKFVSAALLPLFAAYARRRGVGWRRLAAGAGAAAGVSLLVLAPFGPPDWLGGLAVRLLQPANTSAANGAPLRALAAAGLALFVAAVATLSLRLLREGAARGASDDRSDGAQFRRTVDVGFVLLLLAFVLGAARSQPWYLVWPAALAGLSGLELKLGQRRWRWAWPAIAVLSALLLAGQLWVAWDLPGL